MMAKGNDVTAMEIDEQNSTAADQIANPKFSVNVLQLLKSAQMQHGLRFGDYTRYRRYCTARLRRLYKSLKFTHGRGKYTKRNITLSTVTEVSAASPDSWSIPNYSSSACRVSSFGSRMLLKKHGSHAMEKKTLARMAQIHAEELPHWQAKGAVGYPLSGVRAPSRAIQEQSLEKQIHHADGTYALKCFKGARVRLSWLRLDLAGLHLTMDCSLHWLGHLDFLFQMHKDPAVSILKAQELEKDINGPGADSVPAEKKLVIFDKIFAAYNEARSCIRNDLERTIERNQLLVRMAKSKLSKVRDDKNEKVTKPEELVRLYDLLLQNTSDLSDLVSSGRDRKPEEVTFAEECELKSSVFRAERCFYLAKSYSLAGKRPEAYVLYCRARSLVDTALKKLQSSTNVDQVTIKELKMLYNDCRSNICIEHATGVMEEEKAPENLSKKISGISLTGNDKKVEKLLMEKLENYESAVGDPTTKSVPRIVAFPPAFQAVPRNPIVLDLAYNSIEFPSLENRMKKDKKGFISRLWGIKLYTSNLKILAPLLAVKLQKLVKLEFVNFL
ncbi:UNVERIFIED_CONTAM: Signal recognition particle subunit SRP68 [Sesamum calycinum]|uniref:Signal recognition particle subunit SRP68 n=1 Tax=Sesamum calycinum TaxID=2727403 RepID=A0AAW2SX11_9LAMI